MLAPRVVIPSRILMPVLAHADAAGVDTAALCARHGIRVKRGDAGRWPASIDVAVAAQRALFDDVAAALADDVLGVRLGMVIPRGAYGLLEFASHAGRDLQSVVDVTILTTPLVSPVVTLSLHQDGDRAALHHAVDVVGGYGRHAAEMSITAIYVGGRRAVGERLVMREAWFTHAAPAPATVAEVEALLGCPVRYGADDNGFAFDRALLQMPTVVHDEALHAYLLAQAERELLARKATDPFAAKVEAAIEDAIATGKGHVVDTATIARRLAVSPRTLQRRLGEGGVTLSRLHDRVRERLARTQLLAPGARVDEVAHGLGFADVSAFSRAFRRWTGAAPSTFRDHGGQ